MKANATNSPPAKNSAGLTHAGYQGSPTKVDKGKSILGTPIEIIQSK